MSEEAVETVRRSVERTAREGTARLRFDYFSALGPAQALASHPRLGGLFRALDRADVRRHLSSGTAKSDRPPGQIDFRNNRSLFARGHDSTIWRLFVDGVGCVGRPGEWSRLDPEAARALRVDGPYWLLALVAATVGATLEGSQAPDELRCYRCIADYHQATKTIVNAVGPMHMDPRSDPTHLPIEVWLDGDQRVRRVVFFDHTTSRASERRTELELWDFGEVPPIPAPSVLTDDA